MDIQMTPVYGGKVDENGLPFPDINEKASSVSNLVFNSDFDPTM